MPSLIVMSAWRNMGALVIIFLAGLQVVPKEMHEAAAIDGAGAWGRFRHITLPLMRPTLLFGGVITMIGYLQFFEEPFVMTRGGPLDSTLSAAYYTYNQFGFGNYSYAAAMAYVLFVVIALVTAVQFKLPRVEGLMRPMTTSTRPEPAAVTATPAEPVEPPRSRRRRSADIGEPRPIPWVYAVLVGGLVLLVGPFLWMLLGLVPARPRAQAGPARVAAAAPDARQLPHAVQRARLPDVLLQQRRSSPSSITVGNLIFCSMLGYALAKLHFPGKRVIFALVLGTLMVPGVVTFVPLFVLVSNLGMVNSFPGLIFPFLAGPFGVFLMRQFFLSLPDELIHAARVDGAGEFRIFWSIMLPLCKPALATLGILTFLASWNNFLWPLVVAQSEDKYTLPVALSIYAIGENKSDYGLLMAGSVAIIVPVLVVFLVLQKHFVRGIAMTGIK